MNAVIQLKPSNDRPSTAWAMTPSAEAIQNILLECQYQRDMGLIVGAPGTGKTTAIKDYVDSSPHAWLCTLSPAFSTLRPGLARLCEMLYEPTPAMGAHALRVGLTYRLDRELFPGESGLIVIDEAQHAADQLLEELRCIHDDIGIGIVLCGNPTFAARFKGKIAIATFSQLTSRIGARLELTAPTAGDIAMVCDCHGIESARVRSALEKIARQGGGLRSMVKAIRLAERMTGNDEAIDPRHIAASAKMLGIDH